MQHQAEKGQKKTSVVKNKKVGHYIIEFLKLLGKGQYGQVYRAIDKNTNQILAVKVFKKQKFVAIDYQKDAIINQVRIMSNLHSPNIIQFKGIEETANSVYVFQELAEDGSLYDYLLTKQNRRLKESDAIEVLIQLLGGMKELIKNQIIHRDIKLTNFLVKHIGDHQKLFKIADFGLSRYTGGTSSMKTIVGSPIYMAPQMIQSVVNCVRSTKTKYTSKCDIWSFGVVAYELVTGTIPWKIKTCSHKELLQNIKEQCQLQIQFSKNVQISQAYKSFVRGCLQYEQKDRFGWNDVYHHPIFEYKFKDINFGIERYPLADLRVKIHIDNVNLQILVAKLPEHASQNDLVYFFKALDDNITQKQAENLFKQIGKVKEQFVTRKQILNFFQKIDVKLKGLKPKILANEQQNIYKAIGLGAKLSKAVEQNNINLFSFYKKFGFVDQNPRINRQQFNWIFKTIFKNISGQLLDQYFKFFNTEKTATISFNPFYEQLCQAAQVPAVKHLQIINGIKNIQYKKNT